MSEYKLPGYLSMTVLKRYMNEKRIAEMMEEYRANLLRVGGRSIVQPSANDMAIASHLRKVKSYSTAAKDLGISTARIASAMTRVAVWNK